MFRLRHALATGLLITSLASLADEARENTLPLVEQASGAYYVRAKLGPGVESDLLVDTGSSYVALTKATFRQLDDRELVAYVRTIHGRTATGRSIRVKVYSLGELSLGRDCALHDVEAVVLPGADRDILGLTALKKLGRFTLGFEPPALTYSACDAAAPATDLLAAAPPPDEAPR